VWVCEGALGVTVCVMTAWDKDRWQEISAKNRIKIKIPIKNRRITQLYLYKNFNPCGLNVSENTE
jgi:hypothetical protein